MVERNTCDAGIKEDGKLFLQCDMLRLPISSILKGIDKSPKDRYVDSKLFSYALRMAPEELRDPSSTGESGVMIGSLVEVSLSIFDNSIRSAHDSHRSGFHNKVFFGLSFLLFGKVNVHVRMFEFEVRGLTRKN